MHPIRAARDRRGAGRIQGGRGRSPLGKIRDPQPGWLVDEDIRCTNGMMVLEGPRTHRYRESPRRPPALPPTRFRSRCGALRLRLSGRAAAQQFADCGAIRPNYCIPLFPAFVCLGANDNRHHTRSSMHGRGKDPEKTESPSAMTTGARKGRFHSRGSCRPSW